MAVTLNANTSTGFIATSDASGVLQLQTAGTTAVTVDASQNVGIGTIAPIRQFSVGTPNGGANATINMGSGISSLGTLEFSDGTTGDDRFRGYVQYSHADNSLRLGTDAVERMRVLSTGNILSLAGGSTTATGTGIAFPATQSASSDVNTLDDYEEGTWTPVLVPTSGSITTQTNSGAYTKIGGQVTVNFLCIINNVGTATALSSMSGLPFASSSAAGVGAGRESSSTGLMWQWLAGSGLTALSGWTYANNSAIATGYSLRGTLTYFV
jgi:hypothetical protein